MKLEQLIQDSDWSERDKLNNLGYISRAKDYETEKRKDRDSIEETANIKNLGEVVLSTEEVKIYTTRGNEEWDVKYPFRSIYLKDGKWIRSHVVSPSLDVAFLVYLGEKYQGGNSQFTDFALKMLEIKIED